MKLHLLGIPHTVTDDAHHHCAYTAKVQKFPGMMVPRGYEVIHYGVAGAQTAAQVHVDLMTREEQNELRGHDGSDPTKFVGDDGNIGSPLYIKFNRRLRKALRERVVMNDLVLLPFGWGHSGALDGLPFTTVESGVGYPDLYKPAQYRIYESYAWLHYHYGLVKRNGINYEWVIPNYFDTDAWDVVPTPTYDTVVYFGRLTQVKGLDTVVELAHQRPDLHFIICGQGDPKPYLIEPNIEYRPPLTGRDRSALLGHALAVVMPTVYVEPFGGVNVEAQMCGTPVLTPDYGAFTETVEDEVTGFRCHTLGDWLAGLERAGSLDRCYIAGRARTLWGFDRVGRMYDRAFQQIADLVVEGTGWYSTRSMLRAPGVCAPALVPPHPTKIAETDWEKAQEWERGWWLHPERDLDDERRKQDMMLRTLGVTAEGWPGKKVLDAGGGPISPLLRYPAGEKVVLDPLNFGPEYEDAYAAAGIKRLVVPLERMTGEEFYDEVLSINVLQHVQDPEACIRNMLRLAPRRVRIFDWCHMPPSDGHPHTLTPTRLLAAVDLTKWTVEKNVEGRSQDGTAYCALVLQAKESVV